MNKKSEEEKDGDTHDIRVNRPVIGSGVAHSVVTNEWTKNAINPRNTFLENPEPERAPAIEPLATDAPHRAQEPPHHIAPVDALTAHDPLTTTKVPITHNIQRVPMEALADQHKFFESLTKLEEKLHQLKAKQAQMNRQAVESSFFSDNMQPTEAPLHMRDNWQPLDDGQMSGVNRQRVGDGPIIDQALTDTHAQFDADRHIEKRSVYLDKKNIQDNVQFVREQPLHARPSSGDKAQSQEISPKQTAPKQTAPNEAPTNETTVQNDNWREDLFENLDADANAVRELLVGDLGAFNEDELRARVRAMKERLRVANQSLRSVASENEKINPNEPWSDPS